MSWHLDGDTIARYAAGTARSSEAASAEAHLVGCAACRAKVAPHADRSRLDRVFAGVTDTLDAPRTSLVERLLRRAGVPEATARLLVATPALRASWLLAIAAALAFAVAAATSDGEATYVFLAVAPLLPVLGVAVAYGAEADPAYEITVAAPYGGFRLVLLRAAAVLATTSLVTLAAAAFLPDAGLAAAWLLPALALTVTTLALGTAVTVLRAALIVGAAWVAAVAVAERVGADVADGRGQMVYAVVLAVGVAVLTVRRDRFEREEGA